MTLDDRIGLEPEQKPGRSRQDYATPWDFIDAVVRRFGPIVCDLAASSENTKADEFYNEQIDSLSKHWAQSYPEGNLWLNPPFADIAPWAAKCAAESIQRRGFILLLTPASIGTDWFAAHVNRKAMIFGLSPRIQFDGVAPNPKTGKIDGYPKDLMISVYGAGFNGFDVWKWRT